MQSGETSERLGALDRARMSRAVHAILDLRAEGDIPGMMSYCAPDIVCFPPSSWRYAAFPRTIAGKEAVAEALRLRNVEYENLGSEIHKMLIDGDQLVIHRTSTIRERGGSRSYTYDAVDFFRFRDGLVVEFSEFPDGSFKDATENFPR